MKRQKLTRKDKVELSNKDICWKCGGELRVDKQRKRAFYTCHKCQEKEEVVKDGKVDYNNKG